MEVYMRHCCKFDAYDIWYLKDSDEFVNRTLFIGVCPICNKRVAELSQRNIKTNVYLTIKKVGESAGVFTASFLKDRAYSRNALNRMNAKSKPYGWRYGVNKEKKKKDGTLYVEQYSVDFYGNSELVKKLK